MYKVLIVGLGNIGMGYDFYDHSQEKILTHAKAFHLHKAFKIVGGVDVDSELRIKFKDRYSCHAFSDLKDALSYTGPDVVVISTPTEFHMHDIELVLNESNPSIILCEKPMSLDVDKAEYIVNKFEDNYTSLFVNYMRNSEPGLLQIKKMIDDGHIKGYMNGVVWYTKGMYNSASHFISLLQVLLGRATNAELISLNHEKQDDDPELDFSVSFPRGKVRFLSLDYTNYTHATLELISDNGRLIYDHGGEVISWSSVVSSDIYNGHTYLEKNKVTVDTDFYRMQWHVADQIYNQITKGKCTICSGVDALNVLKILNKIKEKL